MKKRWKISRRAILCEGNEQVSKHMDDVDFEGAAYKDCEEDILMDNSSDDMESVTTQTDGS